LTTESKIHHIYNV